MRQRMVIEEVNPAAHQAMLGLQRYVSSTSIDKQLLELIKIRASQINGCANCIDLHAKNARKNGETEQRIYTLSAWRETPFFTPKERAVLALTEAVTLIAHNQVPDDVYNEVAQHCEPVEITEIIMAIVAINGWNRMAITTGKMPQ